MGGGKNPNSRTTSGQENNKLFISLLVRTEECPCKDPRSHHSHLFLHWQRSRKLKYVGFYSPTHNQDEQKAPFLCVYQYLSALSVKLVWPESSRIWHQAEQQDLGRPDLFTHKPQRRCSDRSRVFIVQRTGIWWCFLALVKWKALKRSLLLHLLSSLSIDPVWLMMIDLPSESITLSLSKRTAGHLSVVCFSSNGLSCQLLAKLRLQHYLRFSPSIVIFLLHTW